MKIVLKFLYVLNNFSLLPENLKHLQELDVRILFQIMLNPFYLNKCKCLCVDTLLNVA